MQSEGSIVSHYRLGPRIGEGGMGVVYSAEDTRLGRRVAIKFLPPELAADSQFLERFRREARAASSLNHPNICTIHDVGEVDGQQFLVMELLEGTTLRQRIGRKPLPMDELLDFGVHIADALAAAHAKGIVHRDIKPGNLFVTSGSGTPAIKIMDFGLAKTVEGNDPRERPAVSAAETQTLGDEMLTSPGTAVGTVAYMSPEQARGDEVDARTDLFSFGVVLYEMATGKPPFTGKTHAVIFNAILNQVPPPPSQLNREAPAELDRIIIKALDKDRETRYQTAADLCADLKRLRRESASRTGSAAVPMAPPRRSWTLYAAAALVLAGLAAWMLFNRPGQPPAQVQWEQLTNFTDFATQPALSPDGRMLTFIRGPGTFFTPGQVYVKLLPDGQPVQLTHDERSKMSPIFTPDGSRIAYTVAWPWDTWVVPVMGGESRLMLPNASGMHWIGPDRLLFSEIKSGAHMALVTSRESRTEERDVYVPPHERGMAHRSALSPDGKNVLVVEMDNNGFLPCRLLPFDGSSAGRRVGPQSGSCLEAAWSPDGKWMYFSSDAAGKFHIWRQRVDRESPEQITSGPDEEAGIAITPDGQSLITSVGEPQSELWFHDSTGDRPVSTQGFAAYATMSKDGRRIYYVVRKAGRNAFVVSDQPGALWMTDLDSNRSDCLLPGIEVSSYDVSPDNRRLLYSLSKPDRTSEIWLASLERRFPPRRVSSGDDSSPRFGSGGSIIFRSSEGKKNYLYRMREDGSAREKISDRAIEALGQLSPDGKQIVVWAPGSREDAPNVHLLQPLDGGPAVEICDQCIATWSPEGKYFLLHLSGMAGESPRTYVIPLRRGSMIPVLGPTGAKSADDLKNVPGLRTIDQAFVVPGPDLASYAFIKISVHKNLFRVPLP